MHCWRHKTPIILRATTQWFAGMDECPDRRREAGGAAARDRAARRSRTRSSIPAWGQARLHGMIANRPDWTLSRQRNGACRCRSSCTRRPARCIRARSSCSSRWRSAWSRAASRRGSRVDAARSCSAPTPRSTRRSRTRSTSGSTRARRTSRCCAARTRRSAYPGRPVPRRLRPAPRLVPVVAAGRCMMDGARAVQGAAHARLRRRRRRPQDVQVDGQRDRAAEGLGHAGRRDPAPVGRARPTTRASCRSPTRS